MPAQRPIRPRVSFTELGGDEDTELGRHAASETPSSARQRAAAYPNQGLSRSATRRSRGTRPRHARHAQAPGRSAKRAATGTHRAPGTFPLEAWLETAKNRPQLLLGTLVAAGLLLTAVPIPQSGGENTSVMNAAAQAVAARITEKPPAQPDQPKTEEPPVAAARPAANQPTAAPVPPAPEASRPAPEREKAEPPKSDVPRGDGPGSSLITTGSQVVSLTFDDGPDPNETPKILALLDKYQVKAVFCLVGTQAERHPDLVRQIVEAGHALCNHTWDHDLTIGKKKADQIRADLDRTNAAIRAAVPDAEIPYFRAPGGNFTGRLVSVAYQDRMTSLYWEVDPRDWFHPAGESFEQHVKRIVGDVKKYTRPGSIVLAHDYNQPATTEAFERLMPWLTKNFQLGLPGDPVKPAPSTPVPTEPTPEPSATTPPPGPSPVEPAPEVTPSAAA
ncbi:polysaccharide deacetylase family protein [Actinoplanes aureus]|uniref:polysaccharide deacetylase family protein n=1 Tax=Actinoplanes aureus TaxID=2792083 RepID=UPI002816229A|nr:polysaccharide deacetylase family protein [Actinoplanes aureus]